MSDTLDLGTLLVHLKAESASFLKDFDNAGSKSTKVFASLVTGAEVAGAAVATAFIAMGVAATKAWSDIESETLKSSQRMGNTSDVFRDEMEKTARAIAVSGNTSLDELTSAYNDFAAAGYSAAQSVQALDVASKSADATGQSLSATVQQLTSVQKSFGLSTQDSVQNARNLNDISNLLIKATEEGRTTFDQLANSLNGKVGVALQAYSIDLQDAVGMMTALADKGVPLEGMGKQLVGVFDNLRQAATDNSYELKQYNIVLSDAQGNLLPMNQTLKNLKSAMLGLTDTQKQNILQTIGLQGQSALLAQNLIATSDAADKYTQSLTNVSGATDEMASKVNDTLGAQFQQIWNNIKELVLQVGEAIAPVVKAVIKTIKDLVGSSTEWQDAWKEIVSDIGPALVTVIGMIGDAVNGWRMIIASVQIAWNVLWTGTGMVFKTAMDSISSGMETLVNGILSGVNLAIAGLNKVLPAWENIPKITWKLDIDTSSADKALDSFIADQYASYNKNVADLNKLANQASFSSTLEKNYTAATKAVVMTSAQLATAVKGSFAEVSKAVESADDKVKGIANSFNAASLQAQKITNTFSFGGTQIGSALPNPAGVTQAAMPGINPAGFQKQFEDITEAKNKLEVSFKKAMDDLNNSDIAGTQAAADAKLKIQRDYYSQLGQFTAAQTDMVLNAAGSVAQSLTQIVGNLAGEQSGIYKGMFAVTKAFAIADSTVQMFGAIAKAANDPFPANLADMAIVAAQVGSIVSNIRSVQLTFGGGKEHGGDVQAGKYYMTGEKGVEMFAPGMDGKIIPHDQMMGGGKQMNTTVNVNNYTDSAATVTKSKDARGGEVIDVIIKKVKDSLATDFQNGTGSVNRAAQNAFGLQRGKTS